MIDTFDAIILGAGHNALILQAYLSRAGLATVCLERRDEVGGGLATIEHPPGSKCLHNIHSFYHRALDRMPWYRDLELAQYGAVYLEPELNVAMLLEDGRALEWWTDFEKTLESFSKFSEKDAATLLRWRDDFRPILHEILIPEAQSPPLPPDQRQTLLEASPHGRLLLEVSRLSPLEFVQQQFEHPVVQAGLLFFNGLREVDLRLSGFGHHIPALLASDGMAQLCLGGSKRLAEALIRVIEGIGGQVRLGVSLERIVVENGRATGVETTDGQMLRARQLVASSLNPQQTFLDLIDRQHVPTEWDERARQFHYNLLAPLFALNVNLPEQPHYRAADKLPHLSRAFMVILGLEHVDQFMEIVEHHEQGRIPPTVMWGSCPTQFDPSQAPDGKHTAFLWEKLPYHLDGDPKNWESAKTRHAEQLLETWSSYAPNVTSATDMMVRSPLDTERTLWNMKHGDLLVGAFAKGQVGYHRPFPGAGHYRGHLEGLYLCGSCCHPGGNVTGLPGYNAAKVILADLNIRTSFFQSSHSLTKTKNHETL